MGQVYSLLLKDQEAATSSRIDVLLPLRPRFPLWNGNAFANASTTLPPAAPGASIRWHMRPLLQGTERAEVTCWPCWQALCGLEDSGFM